MKTTKRLYGANTVLYTSVTVMCPVPFPRLCFLLQCSVKLAACFGFGLVILQSSHGWNFFLLSHTVKYFLPLVCRYLLRRFEKCHFYFFGSLLCPSVLHSRLCPVLLLCRHASFFFYRFICLGRFGHTKRTQLVKITPAQSLKIINFVLQFFFLPAFEDTQPTKLYGSGTFKLAPKSTTTSGSTTLYGHYVHPKAELGLSVNVSSYGSFSISGGSNYDERGSQKTISW